MAAMTTRRRIEALEEKRKRRAATAEAWRPWCAFRQYGPDRFERDGEVYSLAQMRERLQSQKKRALIIKLYDDTQADGNDEE